MKTPNFVCIGALALALAAAPSSALAVQSFAKSDHITLVVPFSEGGGTDRWARFYAQRLSNYLPSKPSVTVRNSPGSHGPIDAANAYYRGLHGNGLTLLGTSASVHFPYLLGDKRAKYDYNDWEALLVSPSGGVVYASPELGLESASNIGKLRGIALDYIAQSATGIDIVPLLAMELLYMAPFASFGAGGRSQGLKSFKNGEVMIDFQTTPAYLKGVEPMVKDGDAIPLFSLGVLDRDGKLKRDPSFPDIPHFGEAYRTVHGQDPAGKQFEIWKTLLAAGFSAQKMLLIHKDADAGRKAAYRKAFQDMAKHSRFILDVDANLGIYSQHMGAQARRLKDLAIIVDADKRREIGVWLVTDALPSWTSGAE